MLAIVYTLIVTHITIVSVTLYLHRSQAHRSVQFHPVIEHFFRFWLWLTTGMVTREWVAIHRKHHQASDTEADPHSPKVKGIWHVVFLGWKLYVDASRNRQMVQDLGNGTPRDWIEQHVYTPHNRLGLIIMLMIDVALFGAWGAIIWVIQMIWIPFWAAGVINGLAHWWGYRNTDTADTSRNLVPWAIWIGGEELHNNHHADGASARFSQRWWEIDVGWCYIRLLTWVGLANCRRSAS